MQNKDYENKRRECWEEYKRENLDGEVQWQPVSRYDVFCAAFDRAYALSRQEKDVDTVIQGWVARDENKKLFIYRNKTAPERRISYWKKESCWIGDVLAEIDATLFPDLTWESDPSPVEIIIKRKKNGNSCTDNRI